MSHIPSEKEFDSVIKLNLDKRVKYFRNTVGENCEIWLSHDDRGNLFANYDTKNNECVYVWPAKKYAEWFLTETKFECRIGVENLKSMEIHDFLEEYIDELAESNIDILVFPTENGGALMTAESFRNMMEEELARYED
jgi:frataxin-like iron-binding protein CyaY